MTHRTLIALALAGILTGGAQAAEPLNKYNLCSQTRQTRVVPTDPTLWAAAKRGDTAKVAAALAAGANPNGTDAEGFSLLNLAITEHQDKVLAQLIKAGADVNQPFLGSSPLALARDSTGATESGKPSPADQARRKLLEKSGAKFSDFDTAFMEVVQWDKGSMTNDFLASLKDADNVRLSTFVRAVYDINEPPALGITLLHWAALEGRPEAVSYLIGCGANVNALNSKGVPVIAYAHDRPENAKVLQDAGATASGFTEADLHKYYDDHPNLFASRKVYTLRHVTLDAPAEHRDDLAQEVRTSRSADETTGWLATNGIKFTDEPLTIGAEKIPLTIVDRVAALEPGQATLAPDGLYILVSARPAPVSLDQVRAFIEYFLAKDAAARATKYIRPT